METQPKRSLYGFQNYDPHTCNTRVLYSAKIYTFVLVLFFRSRLFMLRAIKTPFRTFFVVEIKKLQYTNESLKYMDYIKLKYYWSDMFDKASHA